MQKKNTEVPKWRPSWEEGSEEPDCSLVKAGSLPTSSQGVNFFFLMQIASCVHPQGTISWQREQNISDTTKAGKRTGEGVRQAWALLLGTPSAAGNLSSDWSSELQILPLCNANSNSPLSGLQRLGKKMMDIKHIAWSLALERGGWIMEQQQQKETKKNWLPLLLSLDPIHNLPRFKIQYYHWPSYVTWEKSLNTYL